MRSAVEGLGINLVIAGRCRMLRVTNRTRCGQQDAIAFDHIDALLGGAYFYANVARILRAMRRRIVID